MSGKPLFQVDPESETSQNDQVQDVAVYNLHGAANASDRAFILRCLEPDREQGVDRAALHALWLSPTQMLVIRHLFEGRPLQRLMANHQFRPPPDPQTLEGALMREVFDHREHLSILDVWALAWGAAELALGVELPQQSDMDRLGMEAQRLHQSALAAFPTVFHGRTQDNDTWLKRERGSIEVQLSACFGNKPLPPLLTARVRQLDCALDEVAASLEQPLQVRQQLIFKILDAYQCLLTQCCELGEEGPQQAHFAFVRTVQGSLNALGFDPGCPLMRAPEAQDLALIGFPERALPELRRVSASERFFIFQAIERNPSLGLDVGALKASLLLSPQEKDALLRGHNSLLRGLFMHPRTFPVPPQEVVDALWKDVKLHCMYLSNDDLWKMAWSAAELTTVTRQQHQVDRNRIHQEAQRLYQDMLGALGNAFQGNNRWLNNRKGEVEAEMLDRLRDPRSVHGALPSLMLAAARRLDEMLERVETTMWKPPEERRVLIDAILGAYLRLLGQCFALGDGGPRDVHYGCQHVIHKKLDKLGYNRTLSVLQFQAAPDLGQASRAQAQVQGQQQTQVSRKRPADQMEPPLPGSPVQEPGMAEDLGKVADARELLTQQVELQKGLRCLQHAWNNAWANWVKVYKPMDTFAKFLLTEKEAAQPQELGRILNIDAPDGFRMKPLRLPPTQLDALMPVLQAYLDVAIIFKGPTDVGFGDTRLRQTHHFTALVRVQDQFFELESMAPNADAAKIWIPDLAAYFRARQGGVLMAIRGDDAHPLSKYVSLLSNEVFRRTCEALGVLFKKQPIVELAELFTVEEAYDMDPDVLAGFYRSRGFPLAKPHAAEDIPHDPGERTEAILNWLSGLGADRAVLWTGTYPMAMAVARISTGWAAQFVNDDGMLSQRPLMQVLNDQQTHFMDLPPGEWEFRAGFVRALIFPRVASRPGGSAVPPQSPMPQSPMMIPQSPSTITPRNSTEEARSSLPAKSRPRVTQRESRTSTPSVAVPRLRQGAAVDLSTTSGAELSFETSEKILLRAMQDYEYGEQRLKDFTKNAREHLLTVAEAVDAVSARSGMSPLLVEMARQLLRVDREGAHHLGVLALVAGEWNRDMAAVLPELMPPCLAPYKAVIEANVEKWKNQGAATRVCKWLSLSSGDD